MSPSLFDSSSWTPALEKYAEATGWSVALFDLETRLVLRTAPTPLVTLFGEDDVAAGLFLDCARRCLLPDGERRAVVVSDARGLTVVGTALALNGTVMGAAVGGYALAQFCHVGGVRDWARSAGVPFDTLWNIVRRLSPAPERRLILHGELLQVLGDALLGEVCRTRQYEDVAERLRAADAIKDEFLAVLSHELRSPMHAILGWLRVLSSAGMRDPDLVDRAVKTIERNVSMQTQIINDLLDVSRILSGKLEIEHEIVDLTTLVTGCVESLQPTAHGKQVALRLIIPAPGATPVVGDSIRLQQVVSNLVGNAIKFTDADGVITVTVEQQPGSIGVIVEDTGHGIAPEFLPHLFERFRQADGSSGRKHGGLGLGLSIVKHLVMLHGGEVHAASPGIGRGARLSITIPRALDEHRPDGASDTAARACSDGSRALRELDVLVVEDDADSCAALALALSEHGSSVRCAASVCEALEAYNARAPDAVLSDIGLPGESGFALIRAIRAREHGGRDRTIAIAMSGFASYQDQESALHAGFDEHVPKPVQPDVLIEHLCLLVNARNRLETTE